MNGHDEKGMHVHTASIPMQLLDSSDDYLIANFVYSMLINVLVYVSKDKREGDIAYIWILLLS